VLNVATIDVEPGSTIELRDVLLVSDGGQITVGTPVVAEALVVAEVMEHGKGKKDINFKFKAKTRYRRKRGHRQAYTRLTVREIRFGAGAPTSEAAAPARRRATRAAEPAEEPVATEQAPEAETAAPARRRRTTRAAGAEQTQE
jgi:large subunit ribosomal protein L21